jgi:hypothetical protein
MAIPASSVTVNNCGQNECTYSIKEESVTVGGSTTYSSGYDLGFTGATEPGQHSYKVSIQRGSETPVECSGTYTVMYEDASSSENSGGKVELEWEKEYNAINQGNTAVFAFATVLHFLRGEDFSGYTNNRKDG